MVVFRIQRILGVESPGLFSRSVSFYNLVLSTQGTGSVCVGGGRAEATYVRIQL